MIVEHFKVMAQHGYVTVEHFAASDILGVTSGSKVCLMDGVIAESGETRQGLLGMCFCRWMMRVTNFSAIFSSERVLSEALSPSRGFWSVLGELDEEEDALSDEDGPLDEEEHCLIEQRRELQAGGGEAVYYR